MKKVFLFLLVLVLILNPQNKETRFYPEKGVILLTFNGFKPETPIHGYENLNSSNLNDSEQTEIKKIVAKMFQYWDVVITTNDSLFYKYPENKRIRCIIVNNIIAIRRDYGLDILYGKSKINTLHDGDTTAALVSSFNLSPKSIAMVVCHEIGHSLGLNHYFKITRENGKRIVDYDPGDSLMVPVMGKNLRSKEMYWKNGKNMFNDWQSDTNMISRIWIRKKNIKFR